MENMATELYGMTGTFFTTSARYTIPFHSPEYNPAFAQPAPDGDGDDEDLDDDEEAEGHLAPPDVLALTAAEVRKYRDNAYDGRRKVMRQQKLDERRLWSLMWNRVSITSQAKVQEEPDFELAKLNLDLVKLLVFINRSHLTHVYGVDDSMRAVTRHDQREKHYNLQQGDREYISDFKIRFDDQVKVNTGLGIAEVEEESRAIDFLGKLDPNRHTDMLTSMIYGTLQNNPSTSYPTTLSGA